MSKRDGKSQWMLCGLALLISLAALVGCGGPVEPIDPAKPTDPNTPLQPTKPTEPTEPTEPTALRWDKEAAAKALEVAATTWANRNGTTEGQTACLSCHTTSPYLLARPMMRRALGLSKTALESRLINEIKTRVASGDSAKVWYGNGQAHDTKTRQSRGSEAVLNALALATQDATEGLTTPSTETKQAFARLWQQQAKEGIFAGSWEWLDFNLGPWEDQAARYWGATMAAIAAGTAPGIAQSSNWTEGLQRLRTYLMKPYNNKSINLYDSIMLLWASYALDGLLNVPQREKLIQSLQSLQRDDGGWSLLTLGPWKPTQSELIKSDAYATALILIVLQKSELSSSPSTKEAIQAGRAWLIKAQQPSGGWQAPSIKRSRMGQPTSFMNDAATAYAILALTMPSL